MARRRIIVTAIQAALAWLVRRTPAPAPRRASVRVAIEPPEPRILFSAEGFAFDAASVEAADTGIAIHGSLLAEGSAGSTPIIAMPRLGQAHGSGCGFHRLSKAESKIADTCRWPRTRRFDKR